MENVFELFAVLNIDRSVRMKNDRPMVYSSSEEAYKALNRLVRSARLHSRVERVYAADRRTSR